MPVLPSSHANDDDSMPQTPNEGFADTGAGKWPPKDRDPYDPACGPEPSREERSPEPTQKRGE